MALAPFLRLLFLCSVVLMHQLPRRAHAGDPDILTDFVLPPDADPSLINGTFFTYTGLLSGIAGDVSEVTVPKATAAEFPALLGQSVSFAALVYGPGAVNPPHIHHRASELLVVVQGPLFVGLIDAARNGTVHTATLQAGDVFVFPKGMVHFQLNNGSDVARAFSAFGSASPGFISLPVTLFETGIDDVVLEKSLHTDEATVEELKRDLQQSGSSAAAALAGGSTLMALLCVVAVFSVVL